MTKLDDQLQYFISSKITSDKLWQKCSVIYSGHKTPGEGEHKIMEYIRYHRSQPNYDSNTRHCLYGLDADLIMLGLTTHEPHFSLLREEVRFGGKKWNKKTPTPEETTFHLLHLSLMREYIEYEFFELHDTISFKFDLEAIIDDWVFMGFLVGNDFIPNLPGLHINKDALPILYETYKEVLPSLDGYLNEGGNLNLKRFEKFMIKLTEYDVEKFHEFNDNLKYIRGKRGRVKEEEVNERMNHMEKFEFEDEMADDAFGSLEDAASLTSEEVRERLARLDIHQDNDFLDDDESSLLDDEDSQFEEEFRQHKRHYYMSKMLYEDVTSEVLRDQATNYVRGLQWILNYYYNGICSWSWYYPHHYAPYISDIRDFADLNLHFEKGKPFLPYEQLLAVLPPLSVKLLPQSYRKLMISEDSPLKEFYPREFSTDLNGKQQDWEAVVLIPFINEELLLGAMRPCGEVLLLEEKVRNTHGPMFIHKFTSENLGEYKAPDYFPPIGVNHADVQLVWREEWDIYPSDIVKSLLPGVRLDLYFAGFPTLKHVKHTFRKEKASVKVFQQESRAENFILEIAPKTVELDDLLDNVLGNIVFVGWPHLVEAKVMSISSKKNRYCVDTRNGEELNPKQVKHWHFQKEEVKSRYLKRWGVDVKHVEYIIFAKQMTGRVYFASHNAKMTLEKKWSEIDQPFPLQIVVRDITMYDPGFKQYKTIQEFFPPGTKVFMLGQPYYGCMGEVIEIEPQHNGRIRISMVTPVEPNLSRTINNWQQHSERYTTASGCATKLSISPHLFARLTGSVFLAKALETNPFMERETATNKLNIGLNLKSNKRSEEVIGFTRKCLENKQWLYSDQCVKSLDEYQRFFPEIFEFLNKNPSKNDLYQDEIFPTNYKDRVPELAKWLKEAPFNTAERCKWGTVFLDANVVTEISDEVERVVSQRAKHVKMQIKPHLLFKPNPLQGSTPPDPKVTFRLFDRIINVREGFSVPLGATGTVIGIHPAEKESDVMYTILFDKPFAGGLQLAGPVSTNRCYRLSWASVINVSHGQRPNSPHAQAPLSSPGCQSVKIKSEKLPQRNVTSPATETVKEKEHTRLKANNGTLNFNYDLVRTSNTKAEAFRNPAYLSTHPDPCGTSGNTIATSGTSETPNKRKQNNEDSPQPPNPNQLPKPLSFREHLNDSQSREKIDGKNFYTPNKLNSSGNQNKVTAVRQIVNENEVFFVIHGNFFDNWNFIRKNGLKRDHRNYIPCVSYIPPKLASSRSYEIHIYLNIKKLLQDGMRLLLLQKGQVLCSTNKNGFVPPEYFEKVVDMESGHIIFPSNSHCVFPAYEPNLFNNTRVWDGGYDDYRGRGRGRGSSSQPLKLYENIWSQMQNVGQNHYEPVHPHSMNAYHHNTSREGRKEVSVSELFHFASLDKSPKPSTPYFVPLNQTNAIANSQTRNKPLFQNPNDNNKSRFVPMQVARKQTPRKVYHEKECEKSQQKPPPTPKKNDSSKVNFNESSDSSKTSKPRKRQRSRIAANFAITQPVRHDNG